MGHLSDGLSFFNCSLALNIVQSGFITSDIILHGLSSDIIRIHHPISSGIILHGLSRLSDSMLKRLDCNILQHRKIKKYILIKIFTDINCHIWRKSIQLKSQPVGLTQISTTKTSMSHVIFRMALGCDNMTCKSQ